MKAGGPVVDDNGAEGLSVGTVNAPISIHRTKTPKLIDPMITSRWSRTFLLLVACLFSLSLSSEAFAQKKGVAGNIQNAAKVGATWAYDWGSGMPAMPAGVEYVPMSWGYYGDNKTNTVTWATSLKNRGAKFLLTFNEPNSPSQANLSVASALQGYGYLSAGPLPLISPACTDDNVVWMQQFMAGVAAQGLRCDAVAVHSYLRDPYAFLNYIDGIHNRYGKPLWITEFAPTDWASPTSVSVAEVINFIKIAIPGLESRPYVLRYSWYCGTLPGPNVLGTAALFNADGSLTAAGQAYKNPTGSTGGGSAPIANGIYRLQNRATGLMLDNLGATTDGANVGQWASSGSSNQKWNVILTGGYYKISCVTGGKRLDTLGHTTDGSTIGQWTDGASFNQQWTITPTDSGYFKIINRANGKCLDTGGQTTNGSIMQNWYSGGSLNQHWRFVP